MSEVEAMGLEPTACCLQSNCSSQLSYAPRWELAMILGTGPNDSPGCGGRLGRWR